MSDLDAKYYRNNSSIQYGVAQELLDTIELKGDETILDVGCGDGRISAKLSKQVPKGQVVGVDPSKAMIELATASFKAFPNLSFQYASVEEVKLEQQVDLVLIMNALHWVRNPKKAFQNLSMILKPDGMISIVTYPQESIYWRFLDKTMNEGPWQSYAPESAIKTILLSSEYRQLLEELGFVIDVYTVEESQAIYEDAEALGNYIRGWLSCLIPLPRALENAFIKQAVKNAASQYQSKSSKEICIPFKKLVIQAKKST